MASVVIRVSGFGMGSSERAYFEDSGSSVPRVALADSGPVLLPIRRAFIVPEFVPARGASNSHVQTVAGSYLPCRIRLTGTTQRKLRLSDDDFLVLHDDRPTVWERGDHVVLMLHGLGGCHQSGYMVRIASKLIARGVRVFRMDHRGCGAGAHLAKSAFHAGRISDLDAAVRMVERLSPGSPISIVGFSISGNMLLRYLGEYAGQTPLSLFRTVAVCPPIDLNHCIRALEATRIGQRYNQFFTQQMLRHVANSQLWREDLPLASLKRPPRTLYHFDDSFTAPAAGFDSADHYYLQASSKPLISQICVHTTILAAADDPMVCSEPLGDLSLPSNVRLHVTRHGGHLGFIGRRGLDPDRRWMDWRVIEWLLE